MAIAFARTRSLNRADGYNAVGSSAYDCRGKMVDEQSGTIFDYRKLGQRSPAIMLPVILPEGEESVERGVLWNKAELAEKMVNSTIAREMIAALPNELDADAQARIVESVGKFIARQHGVAVDVAIHRDAGNNHAHVLWTTRKFVGGELTAKTRELDIKGTASKALLAIRKHWENECNAELESAGFSERIDMRSYKDQGLDKEGQLHLGPKAFHHQKRTGSNEKHERNEAIKERNRLREDALDADHRAHEYEALADEHQRQAEALRSEAKAVNAESERGEIAAQYSSIFLSPEEEAELAKKRPEPPRESVQQAKQEPAKSQHSSIFFTPEEEAAKELYSACYRFFGGDVPVNDLIADIKRFGDPAKVAMLNLVDANGNRFTHLSSAVLREVELQADGQPGKLVQLRRLVKAFGEIEEAWERAGGKLDRKAHNGSGQSPTTVRTDGLGDWPARQRGKAFLGALSGLLSGATGDDEFLSVVRGMQKVETSASFEGTAIGGKDLNELLGELRRSPKGRTNARFMAEALRALKTSIEAGHLQADADKLARLMSPPASSTPQPTASMTPWAAPSPPMPRVGTARLSPHLPRAPRSPVGTAVRVAYRPPKKQRTNPAAGGKWRAGYAQVARMTRNQVGHGFAKLMVDHGTIQMPLSSSVGGVEPAMPLAEVGRRVAGGSQQNLKPGMWLIPSGASPQEVAAIQAHNKDLVNATASEFSKKFTRD